MSQNLEQEFNVLIVDDNEDNCELLEDIFESNFSIKSVYSGQACLDSLAEEVADLILLDVNMPGMDGYDVCRHLKQKPETALIPVIFVSALASTEERLRGYEVGADDYVTKPFRADYIKEIVAKTLEHRVQAKQMEKQNQDAMSTAFQAMSNSAELGKIIQYMEASYDCKSVMHLAEKLLETLKSFGLNSCLIFRMPFQTAVFGCRSDSIEAKVLQRFCDGDRILDFGARTLINDEHASMLIKNMPLDKPEDYGRIKDNLITLLKGTEARCKALGIEHQLETERQRGLETVIVKSQNKLDEISALIQKQKKDSNNILLGMHDKIENIIFGLGLDETQEQSIISTIDEGVGDLNRLTYYSEHIEQQFQGFVQELNTLSQN